MTNEAVLLAPEELPEDTPETCDRCGLGVRARWLIWMSAGPLTLCGTHYRRYRNAVRSS